MQKRTLWDALDADKLRPLKAAALFVGLLALLAAGVWAALHGMRLGRGFGKLVAAVAALIVFPFLKKGAEKRVVQSVGMVPVPTGGLAEVRSALRAACIAAGEPVPELMLFDLGGLNAYVTSHDGKRSIAVSDEFAELPREEQEAGFALLLGRARLDIHSYAAAHEADEAANGHDEESFRRSWVDAACAGDREGLLILKDPHPVIALLERMAAVDTSVIAASVPEEGVYGFLAWPRIVVAAALCPERERSEQAQGVTGVEGWEAALSARARLERGERPRRRDAALEQVAPEPLLGGVAPASPARTPVVPAKRISRPCPRCGASNAPMNARCIACDAALPAPRA